MFKSRSIYNIAWLAMTNNAIPRQMQKVNRYDILNQMEEETMPSHVQTNALKRGLTVKDLIIMGVFGALLMVGSVIGGLFFAVTPTITFYFSIGAAILPGLVFLLLLAKVPKRGAISLCL